MGEFLEVVTFKSDSSVAYCGNPKKKSALNTRVDEEKFEFKKTAVYEQKTRSSTWRTTYNNCYKLIAII